MSYSSTTKTNYIQVLQPTNQPPSIVSQPTNQTVIAGATATFRVVATGSSPLSYQWFFNQTSVLTGATNATLTLNNVRLGSAGGYSVVVTNLAGTVTSSVATLTVLLPPSIVSQPTNQTVIAGATASFQVVAAGSSPLSYQWFFNQSSVLAGATNATLTLNNVQPASAGGYSVVVTNSAGAVTSSVATLTVLGPPSIVSQPTNQTVIAGATATFQVVAAGSSPLSYQWFFNQTSVLTGATNATLTLNNARLGGAGGYSVVVTNSAGAVTSSVATLTVLLPPSIVSQPTNQTVIAGATATFRVVAAGSSPLSYQWFFNQTSMLAGATNATLTLNNVQPASAGGYSVVVTNMAGAVTSSVATLTVLGPPSIVSQPTNQTVIAGATATFQVVAAGSSPLSYQWFFNQSSVLTGATNSTLTLNNARLGSAGGYSVVVTNLAGTVTSSVATLTVLLPPSIVSQPTNQTVIAGATATFQVVAAGSSPLSYQWFFNQTSVLAGATNATLTLNNVQPASAGGYSVVVTNSAGAVTSSVATLTVLGPPSIVSQPTNQTVIAGATATFQVVAAGSSPLSYQWFFNQSSVLTGATNATLTLNNVQPASAGGYSVVVTNSAGAVTSSVATLTVLLPPSIVSQPTNQTVIAGATASFQVVAAGSSPLSYQWFFNQSSVLAGATNATLTLNNVQPASAGGYSVVVTNSAGAVTSSVATLTVLGPPSIVTQPTNQTVIAGATATFRVVAAGSSPLSYQWFFNQTSVLAGATNATLALNNVQPASAGGYSVIVTNSAGAVTSSLATLTVLLPPSIVSQPTNQTVIAGATATFRVVAAGSSPLSYQWFFNQSSVLTGATNATLTLNNVQPASAGGYSVVVTNPAGAVTSVVATLVVLSGPSVSLTQPTNGASFLAGAALTLVAIASDPQGTVTQVEFFQGGTNLLGIATNAPYSVLWSNVAGGSYALTARATDNYGLRSTSAAVNIVVSNSLLPGLAVSILSPVSLSSFCPGDNILISVAVSNAIGVAEVELFAGGATLLGTLSASPYSLTWPAPEPGAYMLTARATDGQGNKAVSGVVEVFVTSQCGVVAIVRSLADPEIDSLQSYLFADQGLGSHVYDQGGLTAQALDGYKLVIWDNPGLGTNGLAPGTVDALYGAYSNGIPLYLIGERLASGTANLPEPEQSEWAALTRLSASSGLGGDGVIAVQSSISFNPVLDGLFGTVTNFAYPARLDLATNVDASTEVIGRSGGADVLLAYPGFQVINTGQTRLFTQGLRVEPLDAPGSTNLLRGLFENTVYWLLREAWCIDVAMYLQSSPTPDPAQAGQLLEYDLQVTRGGECEATGVVVTNVLPAGVQFVSAQSEQGAWSYDPGARQVTFSLGYLGLSSRPSMSVTVMPVAAGTITNVTGVRINGVVVNPLESVLTNVTEVLAGPNLAPTLGIRLTPPAGYQLKLAGVANVSYAVEASTDFKTWVAVTNAVGPAWSMLAGWSGRTNAASLFYRARVAP